MVTVNWIINAHKVLVAPIVLALMLYFHNWSAAAFLYLGLHGTYTLLWLIKQSVFADKRFAQPIPLWIGVLTPFLPLMAYMIGPYLLISEHTVPPSWVFAAAPFLVLLGVFLHYVSDAQKFFVLQVRKELIEDGLFARTRNPNYLGELLIYSGFVLASWHWEAGLVLAGWFLYFVRNMRRKDRSMSRYPEFAAYRHRTGILFPVLTPGKSKLARASMYLLAAFLLFANIVPEVLRSTPDHLVNKMSTEARTLGHGPSGNGILGIEKDLRIWRVLTPTSSGSVPDFGGTVTRKS